MPAGLGNFSTPSPSHYPPLYSPLAPSPSLPVGAPLAGRLADQAVISWRKRRGGVWVPEDRLRATLWGAGVFVPMSVLLAGLTTAFVPGTPGIVLNLIWLFMNGIGVRLEQSLTLS